MVIAWLVFAICVLIFATVGWTGIYHAKKYKMKGDLTDFAVSLYIFFSVSIIALTIVLVFLNGPNAKIELPKFNFPNIYNKK